MALAIFKQNFKSDIAQHLLKEFTSTSENTYFLFLGKGNPWPNDDDPPTNVDATENELNAIRDSFFLKRILEKDVTLIVNRFPWIQNNVYTQYTDVEDLFDESLPLGSSDFFVVTPEYNVYKCLNNNNDAPSTVMPSARKVIPITTSDGYVWKYMYSIAADNRKFMTTYKMPVDLAVATDVSAELIDQYEVQTNATRGSFEYVDLTNVGAPFFLGTTGAGLPVGRTEVEGSTAIQIIGLGSEQLNIYKGYTVKIVDGYGEGQVRSIVSSEEGSGILYVDEEWTQLPDVSTDATGGQSEAQIIPTINVFGDGTELNVIPIMDGTKRVSGIEVIDKGQNYTSVEYSIYPPNIDGGPFHAGNHSQHRGVGYGGEGEVTLNFVSAQTHGHGSDARTELGGNALMIFSKLKTSDLESVGLTATNQFRQFGIIKNPVLSDDYMGGIYTGKIAGNHIKDTYSITVNQTSQDNSFDGSEFNKYSNTPSGATGTYIMGAVSKTTAKVLDWVVSSTTQGELSVEQPDGTFIANEQLSTFLQAAGSTGTDAETTLEIISYSNNEGRFGSLEQSEENLFFLNSSVGVAVTATGGVEFDETTFAEDDTYFNYTSGISGSKFNLLSWTVGATGTEGTGQIYGTNYILGLQVGDYIHDSSGTTLAYATGVTGPDIRYDVGEVLYIQNMMPIQRNNQQEEEIKVQIGF